MIKQEAKRFVSVYKSRGAPFYPFTFARTVGATPTATLSREREGSRREAEAQDNQGDAKTRSVGGQEGEVDSLGKILAEAAPRSLGKSLTGATCPTPAE